uniref:5-nucleotidase/23-cyclic phosphodiesterase related esterase n=2 Tax=Lactococcus lactis subsp. cremoris TaxID=1359 RepID=A0A896T7K9_LACLC
MMKIRILETSDLHGFVLPTNFTEKDMDLPFSIAKARTKMDELTSSSEQKGEIVIKIENGDILQGSALAYYLAKKAKEGIKDLVNVTNSFGYDVGLLGNHEFNYGLEYLETYVKQVNYPILTANVLDKKGQPAFGPTYQIIERQGVKIGIVGFLTQYIPHWEQSATIKDLTFQSIVEAAKKFLPDLRQRVDVLLVAYHGGFERDLVTGIPTESLTGENEAYQLLLEYGELIDALVTGHQHRKIAQHVLGVPVIQPGFRGGFVGEIELELDKQKKITHSKAKIHRTAKSKVSTEVLELISDISKETEEWLDQPMGKVLGNMKILDPMAARISEHPYIELINKIQMEATAAKISGTALFNNEAKGFDEQITMRSILTNYIYPNTLAVLRVTGADLKAALERTAEHLEINDEGEIIFSPRFVEPKPEYYNYDMYEGIDYTIDLKKKIGQRIVNLSFEGRPVASEEFLEIVVNQYRAVGGGNYPMFSADKIVREITVDMTELIAAYLKNHPVIQATVNHNFMILK